MQVKVKISILNDNDEPFMGTGPVWLLKRIKESKSISQAARDMNMSYAKAHRILKKLEDNLGQKILVTKIGGIERGSASLTPFAEEFLRKYDDYQNKIKEYAKKEFLTFQKEVNGDR